MNKVIISAPFGNYINRRGITSTIGTYTWQKRANTFKRFWKIISTVRYYPRAQTWINKLGLPNPGILSLSKDSAKDKILSIHGFCENDWCNLLSYVGEPLMVELNLSCPNVTRLAIDDAVTAGKIAVARLPGKIIAKLPPVKWMSFARPLYDVGVRHFHLCNTIPTPNGGLSGKALTPYSLWATEEVRNTWGDVDIIGGGGITNLQDIDDFVSAGANRISVGSMLFNPFNWKKLDGFRNYLLS